MCSCVALKMNFLRWNGKSSFAHIRGKMHSKKVFSNWKFHILVLVHCFNGFFYLNFREHEVIQIILMNLIKKFLEIHSACLSKYASTKKYFQSWSQKKEFTASSYWGRMTTKKNGSNFSQLKFAVKRLFCILHS